MNPEITKYKLTILAEADQLTEGVQMDEYDTDSCDAARYRFLCDVLDSDEFVNAIEEIVETYDPVYPAL